ncbi:polysaccharide deacetylase [Variovorax sp. VNK109]|uniref:polysaccharide deacetylase n=1 Tax=Variovorax sp. VNK109 TaxID=3400919 RepID=UPI003C036D98
MLQFTYRPQAPATRRERAGTLPTWSPYDPIEGRPPLKWPGGARVAVWICPNVLLYEPDPPRDAWLNAWSRTAAPDVLAFGRQEYGPRVGFWRMLEVLDKHRARCSAVVNSAALAAYPDIRAAAVARGWDFIGHGIANTRFIYGLDEAQERAYWREMRDGVEQLTGVRMAGTGGPGPQAATESTPDLLAEEGFLYHGDWFHDDQPFPLRVRAGKLISMPYAQETNDAPFFGAAFEADQFADACCRQFDRLYEEGAHSGRVFCLSVHPALIGQPQRIAAFDRVLSHVLSHPLIWQATGAEIAGWYMTNCHDAMLAHACGSGKAARQGGDA